MKIVHAADLHLDSPLRGLTHYEGAPVEEVRSATRKALIALVDLCLAEAVQLLVLAGDLYDGDFKDYSTALFFTAQMMRLREGDVQVVWIRGNHDAANRMTRHLHVATHVQELASDRPETRVFERWGVAVHGQGYASRDLRENLARHYPRPLPGMLNLGLLHTALDGREGHAPYAPCTSEELLARGYDYWALGHVHQREVIAEDPWIVFSGNLQGRHIKETGPKGCTLLEISGGRIESVSSCILDRVRWECSTVDLSAARNLDDAIEGAVEEMRQHRKRAGSRVLATRVRLVGPTEAHSLVCQKSDLIEAELRARSLDLGDVYLEKVEFRTRAETTWGTLAERKDALGELFRSLDELSVRPEERQALWKQLLKPLAGISDELLRHDEIDPLEVLDEARQLLEGRLVGSDVSGGVGEDS